MSVHDAFIASIRETPDDDAPRLIYADFLEEHGDPDRAEFIRLQCRMERRSRDAGRPPLWRDEDRAYRLQNAHEEDWLGEVPAIGEEHPLLEVRFRRGFAEWCSLDAPFFLHHAAKLVRSLPLWQEATFSQGHGAVGQLVTLPEFARLSRLTFASRLDLDDARALADWPGLVGVRSLRFWGGERRGQDSEICNVLARSPHGHALQAVEMIQVRGGVGSNYPDTNGGAWARRLEKRINARFGRKIFRVSRPFERLFSVKGCDGYGFYAGALKERQALIGRVRGESVHVAVFDADGTFLEEFDRPLPADLQRPPQEYHDVNERKLSQFFSRELGFRRGRIQVREFLTRQGLSVHLLPRHYQQDVDNYDPTDPESSAINLQEWIDRGDFVLDWGNDYFMDANGEVTSS